MIMMIDFNLFNFYYSCFTSNHSKYFNQIFYFNFTKIIQSDQREDGLEFMVIDIDKKVKIKKQLQEKS
jgi:hypothetical protein